jgi:hypothetical protein
MMNNIDVTSLMAIVHTTNINHGYIHTMMENDINFTLSLINRAESIKECLIAYFESPAATGINPLGTTSTNVDT